MNAFAPGVSEKIGFYVYLLIDPRDGAIFYVGKGKGDRCFDHVQEARKTPKDTVGDYSKLARIREIESAPGTVRIEILRHGLTEPEAFLVESAAIDLLRKATTRYPGYWPRRSRSRPQIGRGHQRSVRCRTRRHQT